MKPYKIRYFTLLILYLISLSSPAFSSESSEKILLNLPREKTVSQKSFSLIEQTLKNNQGKPIIVDCWSLEQCLYAKIILHSQGIHSIELKTKSDFKSNLKIKIPILNSKDIAGKHFKFIIIVLGAQPLDDSTPTIDMVYRIKKAAEIFKTEPDSLMVMTGGKTNGTISESEMMALIALFYKIPADKIVIEKKSRSTIGNAYFSSALLKKTSFDKIIFVTRTDHLKSAQETFRKYPMFKNIEGVDCGVKDSQRIKQMEDFLKIENDPRVK